MGSNQSVTLREAVELYLSSLKTKDDQSEAHQQLHRFVRWCGADREIWGIAPPEIGEYGEHTAGASGGASAVEHLQMVRKFLTFAKKQRLIQQGLAQHLRVRKGKRASRHGGAGNVRGTIELTPDRHNQLVDEMESLKAKRIPLASEIRRAAADKDVRENVPLEAAREQLGMVESRIRQVEDTLMAAVVVDAAGRKNILQIGVGAKVVLKDLDNGRETRYTLVSALEANPLQGMISEVSPVGKALLTHLANQEIEVETPRGKLRYRILKVSS